MPYVHTLALTLAIASGSAHAMSDAALADVVGQRLTGDRTGACMAVAVVEHGSVTRTFQCADPKDAARIGPDTAFEIGSVSKTMTAALLADLIGQGKGSLDDPLSAWLPPGTKLPDYQGKPILLRHIVTHTSGLPSLPSRMGAPDMTDPYAKLDEAVLLASLGDVVLTAAPGTKFEYSNFASMVLSYAVARRAGTDMETLLKQRLFAPLGMQHAYLNAAPSEVRAAVGHTPNGRPTSAWHFQTNLAGVGGVRATLDDMVRYVQGNLGAIDASISPALELAQKKVSEQPPMAMNWMLARVGERIVHTHEGGTGGFSSFVSVDREKQRGVVILSDTAWHGIGGLGSLGLHLVDASFPLGQPRKLATPTPELLDALVGQYQLQGAMTMTLSQRDGKLFVQATGQDELEMGYDDAGDFFPLELDATLVPRKKSGGDYGFTWSQMGAVLAATRIVEEGHAQVAPPLTNEQLAAFAGNYALMPGFVLTVRARDGKLHAQATGQGEFPLDAAGADTFEAAAYGIEIVFKRDQAGAVASLDLHQGGQVLSGKRN